MRVHSVAYIMCAVEAGRISEHEADAILRAEHNISFERAKIALAGDERSMGIGQKGAIAFAVLLMFVLGFAAFNGTFQGDAPTGFITLDVPQPVTNSTYVIGEAVSSLAVSGVLIGEGEATIRFETPNASLLVAHITSDSGAPRTAQAAYAPGENVVIEHMPMDATYYLDDGTASTPIDVPLAAPQDNATLLIIANESGLLTTYRLPIIIGAQQRETTFENECGDACSIDPSAGVLVIETTGDASVRLSAQGTGTAANTPPQLTTPYATITIDAATTIALDGHFTDTDGDELHYSVGGADLVEASVDGSTLTIIPLQDGEDELIIYVSDLHELVSAPLLVTVALAAQEANTTQNTSMQNVTIDVNSTNDVNITLDTNITTNETLLNGTLDCTNPDPNMRPLDCLVNETRYFEENIYIEDINRVAVARVAPIGNLLITGDVFEYSTAEPAVDNFALGYRNDNFVYVPTVWIDSEGNLHLRGRLIEEETHIDPPNGAYTIRNQRGIYLLWADKQTGDLYVRGNVIPYRRSVIA